ncbi:hypothetical protein [Burkholderia phage FLC9]|nr:hypothetical protein [Burkholderia phage FLC9]
MASKAGRVQFKDIKAGKVFWLVRTRIEKKWREVLANGNPVDLLAAPVRVEITKKPFRTMVEDDLDGLGHLKHADWTFEGRVWYDEVYSEKHHFDCSAFGIFTDVSEWAVKTTVDYFFTTQRAALRYCERMERSPTYRIAFEHPHMWRKAKLRKRVGEDWQGKKTIYGDFPTRTNSHRPWLHYSPLESLVGGIVVGPQTPKKHIEYFMEQSRKELEQMYPNVIEPIVILDEAHEIDPPGKSFVEVEASIKGKPVAMLGFDPAGPTLTHVTIGNGDKIHSHTAADRHVRALHFPVVQRDPELAKRLNEVKDEITKKENE